MTAPTAGWGSVLGSAPALGFGVDFGFVLGFGFGFSAKTAW